MTSAINTNGINVNYPVPGINNNSQGFRDNFSATKTNLNTAATEITDLQSKVVVKQALTGTIVDNDMANTLISNAVTRSFRASTYNLGNALSGTVVVDASLGDVQYGTIAGNTTIQLSGWAPSGTQSNVQLEFAISNANAVISFPSTVSLTGSYGVETLENFSNVANVPTVTIPNGVSQLEYRLSTVDCGNTVTIEPFNRPRVSTQVQQRLVPPTGLPGDVTGTIAISTSSNQLNITSSNAADYFTTSGNTTQLYTDMPVVFTGASFEANITSGTTYYIRNVVSSNTFTVSSSIGGANINLSGSTGTMYLNPQQYMYVATDDFNSTVYNKSVTATAVSGNITLNNTTSLANNAPIVFAENMGTLVANTVYYIKSIGTGGNITVSLSRTNGVADTAVTMSANTTATTANVYIGNDIWKRITLSAW